MATLTSGPAAPVSPRTSTTPKPAPVDDRATYLAFVAFMVLVIGGSIAAMVALLLL